MAFSPTPGFVEDTDPPPKAEEAARGGSGSSDERADADRREIERLAALPPLERDRKLKEVAKQLGCSVTTLRAEVEKLSKAAEPAGGPGAGRSLEWPEPDPWPEPVDGAELLDDLAATFRNYVVLPASCDTALALWVVHAHAFEASPITPRLAITSPEKRCGKTTALEIVQALAPRPILASNITAAAVFRTIELARPTLLIDEADTFLAEAEELRGILNSGHRRTGEVIRTAGEDHEPRRFSTWGPVAIAAIGKIPGTLDDRSIKVELRRRAANEPVERWRADQAHQLEPLVRRCARWAADHLDDLRQADPAVPVQLHDRAADNWRPLLAIAELAGAEWSRRATKAAETLSAGGAAEGRREMLLADLRAIFVDRGEPKWIATAEIIKALVEMEERPWSEHSRGKAITPKGLQSMLEPFKIHSSRSGGRDERARGYALTTFTDAWARYLPVTSVHTSADQQRRGFDANHDPSTSSTGGRMRNGPESSNGAARGRVDGSNPPKSEKGAKAAGSEPIEVRL